MLNVVHVTHEAVVKIGGIGAVLEGLITCPAYVDAVHRTLLLCPLWSTDGDVDSRLGPEGEVQYSSIDGRTSHALADAFRAIQQKYHVEIVYGHRMLRDPITGAIERPEIVLIDVSRTAAEHVNALKFQFFEKYGMDSTRFEGSWEYEQWVRLAEPGLAAVRAIFGCGAGHPDCVVIGHEFMGLRRRWPRSCTPSGTCAASIMHTKFRRRERSSRSIPATTRCFTTCWTTARQKESFYLTSLVTTPVTTAMPWRKTAGISM